MVVDEFIEGLEAVLQENERLSAVYMTRKSESVYVLFRRSEFDYMPIRISNHGTKAFFSNKTFQRSRPQEDLLEEIRCHMDESDWYTFTYKDFFGLRMLHHLMKKHLYIYIDNTMHIFDRASMGLLFYEIVHSGRNRKDMLTLSDSYQKLLRRLFAAGLIAGRQERSGDWQIYVTFIGMTLLSEYKPVYYERYWQDFKSVDMRFVEVPSLASGI